MEDYEYIHGDTIGEITLLIQVLYFYDFFPSACGLLSI